VVIAPNELKVAQDPTASGDTLLTRKYTAYEAPVGAGRKVQVADGGFQANYLARFQLVLDGSECSAKPPILQVLCQGDIELLQVSNPTIECSSTTTSSVDGFGSGFECKNTCSGFAACSDIWLTQGSPGDGSHGEIYYACSGGSVNDVDSQFRYLASEDNSCGLSTLIPNRIYHVAKLGILCSDEQVYNFGEAYFECGAPSTGRDFFNNNQYTCFTGKNCGGSDCIIDIDDMVVEVDLNVLDCIQGFDYDTDELPEPDLVDRPAGSYTAKFSLNWGLLQSALNCDTVVPQIFITCTNGILDDDVETLYATTSCEKISASSMVCSDSDSSNYLSFVIGQDYTGVSYVRISISHIIPGLVYIPSPLF